MKYLIFSLLLILLIISCTTSNSYKKIQNITSYHNKVDDTKFFLNRGLNPTKTIFHKLSNQISSDSIIYIFSWRNKLPQAHNKDFSALIFDKTNKKKYYAYNLSSNYKDIIINSDSNNLFLEETYLLDKYLMGEIASMKKFENQFSSVEMGTTYYIIDLSMNKLFYLESIVFNEEGYPVSF